MAMTAPAVETSEGTVEDEAVTVWLLVEGWAGDLAGDVTGADVMEIMLLEDGATPVEGTTVVVETMGGGPTGSTLVSAGGAGGITVPVLTGGPLTRAVAVDSTKVAGAAGGGGGGAS